MNDACLFRNEECKIHANDLFVSLNQTEVSARSDYAVRHRQFCLLMREAGAGISAAIRTLSQHIDSVHHQYLYICDSVLTPNLFYREALLHVGIHPTFKSTDMKRQFHTLMLDFYENKNKIPVVVLDEAHHFSETILQELRYILNFKEDSMSPLALFIEGQPSLRNALRANQLEAIDQQIQMHFQLTGLTEEETGKYIRHQLKVAGTPHVVFSNEAIQAIHSFSHGNQRKNNTLCSQVVVDAFLQKSRIVGESNIHRVINEM